MIEAGEVGAVFRVVDEASPVLRALTQQFERLDAIINRTKEQLSTLRVPPGAARALTTISERLEKLPEAASAAMAGVTANFDKIDAVLERTKVQVGEITAEMKGLGRQAVAADALAIPGAGGGGRRSIRNGGGGHGGNEGPHIHGGPRMELPGGIGVGAKQGSDGFWELVTGAALIEGVKHVIEARMELETLEAHAKAAGYTNQQQAEIMAAAWANAARTMNTTASESYKNILELAQVTGSYGEAIKMLPAFTGANVALSSLKDQDLRASVGGKSQTYDFARSLELLGVTQDDGKLSSMTSAITREIIGMRGLVDGSKMFQGIQNAGGARYGWNEDFVGHVLGPLLQASPRAGAGLYQLDRSYGAGVSTLAMAQGAEKYGFWNKSDEIYDNGHFKGMKTGSIAGYDMLRQNPEEWATKIALPLLQSHGVNTDDTNAVAKAITEMSRGNKNLSAILDELLLPGPRAQLAKERENIDKVPTDAAAVLTNNDPSLKMQALKDKWNDLMSALGGPLIDKAMSSITSLTSGLNNLAQFMNAHPLAADLTANLMAVSGAFLALSGSAKMLKFFVGDMGGLFGGGAAAKEMAAAEALMGSARALDAAAAHLGGSPNGPGGPNGPGPKGPPVMPLFLSTLLNALNMPGTGPGWFDEAGNRGAAWTRDIEDTMRSMGIPDWIIHGGLGDPLTPHGDPLGRTGDAAGLYERSMRAQNAYRQDPEAARGKALGALTPPPADITKALQQGAEAAKPAIGSATSTGVVGGLNSATAQAQAIISSWFQAAAAAAGSAVGAALQKSSAAAAPQEVHVHTAINMDGKTIARNSEKHIVANAAFPTQAPYFDRYGYAAAPDVGYSMG